MIYFEIGNLFDSKAECLVNGVNCEGIMGKGVAFQFKQRFPLNYARYVEACRNGECSIGRVFFFEDGGKLIANFPSKNKWRQPSELFYISSGLKSLVSGLENNNVSSVAIPPIGCGNGGLDWTVVKPMIIEAFSPTDIDVFIYEPAGAEHNGTGTEPRMTEGHLILLRLASLLYGERFSVIRLEAAAFFLNFYSGKEYFPFSQDGILSSEKVKNLSMDIRRYKELYGVDSAGAERLIYGRIVSESVRRTCSSLEKPMRKASSLVNEIGDDGRLRTAFLIVRAVRNAGRIPRSGIPQRILNGYSVPVDENETEAIVDILINAEILNTDLLGDVFLKA
jgi:O-acetyl-ADP-ribose deacetylase (regulator of RNase III)